MPQKLLPTSLVGSYAQPDWLIDRKKLAGRFPPRVRAKELWRVTPEFLDQAQDDATVLAIRDQERAGLDIVTDGEMRRESYSNRFATGSMALTSTTLARRSIVPAIPILCRVSLVRCGANIRSRCAMSNSCVRTRTA
jgi:methionine synthase II (cobalamin-independent)